MNKMYDKVKAGRNVGIAAGTPLAVVLAYLIELAFPDMPVEVTAALVSLITTGIVVVAGWLKPEIEAFVQRDNDLRDIHVNNRDPV